MGLLVSIALVLAPQDRADRLFAQVTFGKSEAVDDFQKRVETFLRRKEHWTAAFRAIEEKIAPFPDGFAVDVAFDLEGENPSTSGLVDAKPFVKFNLRRLAEYQVKIDEIEKQKKDLAKQGKRVVFQIPPLRFERLIPMELAKVLLDPLGAPKWFTIGLAAWVSEEMNYMAGFAVNGKKVEEIEAEFAEPHDVYGRGQAFWKWMDTKGAVRKAVKSAIAGTEARKAVEEAAGIPWAKLVVLEKEWSAKTIDKLRPAKR